MQKKTGGKIGTAFAEWITFRRWWRGQPCFFFTKEEIVFTIESVMIGISRIAKTSSKAHVKWERIVHSHTHQKRIDPPVHQEQVKEKGMKKKKNAMVAIVNIANHRQRSTSGKFFNTHMKAEGNIEQVGQSQMSVKRHSCVHKETSVREDKHHILVSEFGKSKNQRPIPICERDLDQQQKRSPNAPPPYDLRSTSWR